MRNLYRLGLALSAMMFATALNASVPSEESEYVNANTSIDYSIDILNKRSVDLKVTALEINTKLDYVPNRILIRYVSKVNVFDPLPLDLGEYRQVWEDG